MDRKVFRHIDDECDLSFRFTIHDNGTISCIVHNNLTDTDSSIFDLNLEADNFYHERMMELREANNSKAIHNSETVHNSKSAINRIKEILYNRKVV